jgi:two-component system nitrogen regulation response regulator GlnG
LRERREDIAELAHYFLFRFNRQLGTQVQSISEESLELLQRYDWPGNVREMQSVIREALIVSAGPTLLPEFLPAELRRDGIAEPERAADSLPLIDVDWTALGQLVDNSLKLVDSSLKTGKPELYRQALDHFDRLIVSRTLQQTSGNQAQAAEILGISRPTLRAKLRSLNLTITKSVEPGKAP